MTHTRRARLRALLPWLLAAALVGACSKGGPTPALPGDTPEDAGPADAGRNDAAETDAGGGIDIGFNLDTGPLPDIPHKPDTGADTKDAGAKTDAEDAGTEDAGTKTDTNGSGDTEPGLDDADAGGGACKPGELVCQDGNVYACDSAGHKLFLKDDCKANGLVCAAGACKSDIVCDKAAEDFCDAEANAHFKCLDGGKTKKLVKSCGILEVCAKDEGFFACFDKVCQPGQLGCDGDKLTRCNSYGNKWLHPQHPDVGGVGEDCAKKTLSCVLVAGKPACAVPSCGDGKKNGEEECDKGADNGGPKSLCTKDCKLIDQSCKTAKDCNDKLPLQPCQSHWECVIGTCAIVKSSAVKCDDGNACTKDDHCNVKDESTICVGTPIDCDDGNPCSIDSCDSKSGGCHAEAATLGRPCDDGNKCTVGDQCLGKVCNPGENACICKADKDCAGYDDGDRCNGTLICKAGQCQLDAASVVTCGKGVCINPSVTKKALCEDPKGDIQGRFYGGKCHLPGVPTEGDCKTRKGDWIPEKPCRAATCLPHLGLCVMSPKPGLSACDDGNACTRKDVCTGGSCLGAALSCNDHNACTDDSCDPGKGCVFQANTKPCSDRDSCTRGDKCEGGTCVGGANQCECKLDPDCKAKDSKVDLCVGTHICVANKCVIAPKTIVKCPDKGTECAPIGCNPASGKCEVVGAPGEGTPCSIDGDLCVVDSVCTCAGTGCPSMVCKGKDASCDDGNDCTLDTCDKIVGCVFTKSGDHCDDGDPCTVGDRCGEGRCQPGKQQCTSCGKDKDCEDKLGAVNKCQGGWQCVKNKCINKPKYVQCDSGTCSNKGVTTYAGCLSAKGKWTDYGECAVGACDPGTGGCIKVELTSRCDDNDPCTVNDWCKGGVCKTDKRICNDEDPCTLDSCASEGPSAGCKFDASKAEGLDCEDGNKCTIGSKCKTVGGRGVCLPGTPKSCDDGNDCTADACNEFKGQCLHGPNYGGECGPGDKCVAKSWCDPGKGGTTCVALDKVDCPDKGFCVKTSCDPLKGCEYVNLPDAVTCPAYSFKCSDRATCQGGNCVKDPKSPTGCDDGNACTTDSCNEQSLKPVGCEHEPNTELCDDKDACTEDTRCMNTVCFGTKVDCDDENACTADSCDSKIGCAHKPVQGVCGVFAQCDSGPTPGCVFSGGRHIVISELHLGGPRPADDFVELHNASTRVTDLGDYVVQVRAPELKGLGGWTNLALLPKGHKLLRGAYLVVGNVGKFATGYAPDVSTKDFTLPVTGGQIRIFDRVHSLEHDRVAWGVDKCGKPAAGGEGKPLGPWPGYGSWQRKADATSTAAALAPGGCQWLAGNDYDSGDNASDFVHSRVVEPQFSQAGTVYEPACPQTGQSKGCFTCGGQAPICDFKGPGADHCVPDKACSLGCGPAQACEKTLGMCVPDPQNRVVISEVFVGSTSLSGQFVEIHNPGKKAIDVGGLMIEADKPSTAPGSTWDQTLATIPAGTRLPAGRFYLVATRDWLTKTEGGADQVFDGKMVFGPKGGAVHILDPRTRVELDLFGWGLNTKTASYKPFAIPKVPDGQSLVRKATTGSHPGTMSGGGKEVLAGNGRDTDNDSADWTLRTKPEPWSLRGGRFKPACGGACAGGMVCNFDPLGAKCIDPTCGGCKFGASCNWRTGKCDQAVMISAYTNYGPPVKFGKGTITANYNWFIELYNPGDTAANLSGMLLQYKGPAAVKFTSLSKPFPDGTCVKLKTADKQTCNGATGCECKGAPDSKCSTDNDCHAVFIKPHGYALFVPVNWDPALPKPDLRSHFAVSMDPDHGVLRLVNEQAWKIYGATMNHLEADLVAWGSPGSQYETDMLKQVAKVKICDGKTETVVGKGCMLERLPRKWPEANAATITDPLHASAYAGAGRSTSWFKDNDWVRVCPRRARNSESAPQKP